MVNSKAAKMLLCSARTTMARDSCNISAESVVGWGKENMVLKTGDALVGKYDFVDHEVDLIGTSENIGVGIIEWGTKYGDGSAGIIRVL